MAFLSLFLYFPLLDLLDRWFDYELYISFCAFLFFLVYWIQFNYELL